MERNGNFKSYGYQDITPSPHTVNNGQYPHFLLLWC